MAGLCHDGGLAGMMLGVEHLMRHTAHFQHVGQQLADLYRDGTYQHGLAGGMAADDLLHYGLVLALLGGVDHIVEILADHGLVGGNLHHVQRVDALELGFFGFGGTRHTRQLMVHAEEILIGDGGQGTAFALYLDMLLGLQRLVQTVGEAATYHDAAGELVHDHDLVILHHIVHVALHDGVGLERLDDVVVQLVVFGVGQVFHAEVLFGLFHACLGQGGALFLFVHPVIAVNFHLLTHQAAHGAALPGQLGILFLFAPNQAAYKAIGLFIHIGGLFTLAGDNQRRARLIDEDGVHLVHDGKVVLALHHVFLIDHHVVTQVIKAQLVIGAVGDIAAIGGFALLGGQAVEDDAHAHAQKAVELAHFLALELGQVIVDGDDVHALARQRVQIGGHGGGQRFAFAGFHLGDAALMQYDAADHLHPEGAHAQHALAALTHHSESLGQQLVQLLPALRTGAQLVGLFTQLIVGQLFICRLQRVDGVRLLIQGLEQLFGAGRKQFLDPFHRG